MPKLTASAVVHGGRVFTGLRHCDAIKLAVNVTGIKPVKGCQGFIDEEGTFHDRYQARIIAIMEGQVKEEDLRKKDIIFSEDLW